MSTGEEPWIIPPREVLLEPGSLHVWRAPLDVPADVRGQVLDALATGEREEADRFARPTDRTQWMLARASLRVVLAKYVGGDPRALRIVVGASGKPHLQQPGSSLRFNLSHSGTLALIAVSQGREVGVDVERIRDVRKLKAILDDFFSEQEQAYVLSREGQARTAAFFVLWTRREAAAKAAGMGLFEALSRFALPLRDADGAGFRIDVPQSLAASGGSTAWWLRDLTPAAGFAGAVCTEGANPEPSLYELRL